MKTLTTFACLVALLSSPVARAQSSAPAPGDPIHTASPKYPKDARKQKVEGKVTLHVMIASDGSVKDVAVVNGDSRLTDAALAAVRKWRFQPFIADGKPVEGQRDVTMDFTLADGPTQLDDSSDPISTMGGGARASPPRITYSPDPEYSPAALEAHVDGIVTLSIVVGTDGKPRDIRDIKVVRSPGYGLDEKAIEAVREWRFQPASKDGKPVAVLIMVQVQFRQVPR
jgi:TonB family protein